MMSDEKLKEVIGDEMYGKLSDEAKKYICNVAEKFGNEFADEDIAKIVRERYGL